MCANVSECETGTLSVAPIIVKMQNQASKTASGGDEKFMEKHSPGSTQSENMLVKNLVKQKNKYQSRYHRNLIVLCEIITLS